MLRTNPSKAALSPSLFVGERACSSRCTEYCHSHNHLKSTTIPCSAPPHLPPLSKGGGLTASHKLLLCCFLLAICPPFLYCKLFCRQDGGIALHLPTLPKPHYPSKTANTLASPRKRGGGTADRIFSLAAQHSDSPTFTILKVFRAVTVGIEINRSTILKTSKHSQSQSLHAPHQPFPKPHYPLLRTTTLASLVKGRWIDGKAQALTLLHLLAICPPFLYCKLFCRQDRGIVPLSLVSYIIALRIYFILNYHVTPPHHILTFSRN